jgi:hypothetical protein
MSDREPHCPFLNRADHRCSTFFSIEQLQHAFEHCFHAYKSCSVYQELLVERQARRNQAAGGCGNADGPNGQPDRFVWTTACRPPQQGDVKQQPKPTTQPRQFVQVRLPSVGVANVSHGAGIGTRAAAY